MSKKQLVPLKKYDVGYGKPPKGAQFTTGQSGNPFGRPKGSINRRSKANEERLRDIVLEEAHRKIPVQEDGGLVKISMLQAMLRSMAVKAAKGDSRSQKLMMDIIRMAEVAKIEQEEEDQININIVFTE
jgi:hypothetical protein